ncbi:RING-H2 finger protein [Melia azedarach]|uniref:RING-H2 finger protein n=1 Tax=Melia azedarach TaxID=155640 RepID=A0ACC1XLU4_MELAZ|nr:RING-H2 finger protein [Melia azedarach]
MSRILQQMKHRDGFFVNSPPSSLSTTNSFTYESESTSSSSSSGGRISPVILLSIVIVAVIFFVSGLLHLLVRYLKKRPSSLPNHQSNRYPETPPGSHALQRQLQQLFRLHDSGLDQALIDALPVFYYRDIVGLKEPFDCAVCLCEFSEQDKLRLLPTCGHAFHISCIDTWLLSNSTCPLCRGNLLSSSHSMENPVSSFEILREISNGFTNHEEKGLSGHHKPEIVQERETPKRVFTVRLGKFRSLIGESGGVEQGETTRCTLDARRCYSMGAFQYVVVDSDLQVSLSHHNTCGDDTGGVSSDVKFVKERREHGNSLVDGELEEKKISSRSRVESYSVSKIWLWSKKSRFSCSSSNNDMDENAYMCNYFLFP